MGIIRNFIDIVGITPENELPDKVRGQIFEYSDIETIFIPESKPGAKTIFEISIILEVKDNRVVDYALGKTCILDGVKKLKVLYTGLENEDKANIVELSLPFNTFFEFPKNIDTVEAVKVYIMDAYFDLVDTNKIYSHILYLVNIIHDNKKVLKKDKIQIGVEDKKFRSISNKNDIPSNKEFVYKEVSIAKEESDIHILDVEEEYCEDIDSEYL